MISLFLQSSVEASTIVLIAAEKGGSGKSTLTTNLSVHLARHAVDLVLIDTDAQATSARFVERRDSTHIQPVISCVQRTGDVSATLRDLSQRYQVVIVDAGGRDSREMRSAMAVADLMLIPTRVSQADLETLPKVNELVSLARGINPKLKATVVLSRTPTNPTIREVQDAREPFSQFDQITVADTTICDRKVFRDALLSGNGVVELGNSQARAEIQLLTGEFFELAQA